MGSQHDNREQRNPLQLVGAEGLALNGSEEATCLLAEVTLGSRRRNHSSVRDVGCRPQVRDDFDLKFVLVHDPCRGLRTPRPATSSGGRPPPVEEADESLPLAGFLDGGQQPGQRHEFSVAGRGLAVAWGEDVG